MWLIIKIVNFSYVIYRYTVYKIHRKTDNVLEEKAVHFPLNLQTFLSTLKQYTTQCIIQIDLKTKRLKKKSIQKIQIPLTEHCAVLIDFFFRVLETFLYKTVKIPASCSFEVHLMLFSIQFKFICLALFTTQIIAQQLYRK